MTNKIQDREKYNQMTARRRQGAASWLTRYRLFLSALLLMAGAVEAFA